MQLSLTPRQLDARRTIEKFIREHSYAPSLAELAGQLDIGRTAARDLVLCLEERGHIQRKPNHRRAMALIPMTA